MNKDKIYTQWINQRRQAAVPKDFSDRVMAEIQNQKPKEQFTFFDRFDARHHFLTRWAAALGLIALGIYRIIFVTANLLFGSTL